MKKIIKNALSAWVFSMFFVYSAYAEGEFTLQELEGALNGAAEIGNCELKKVVFARGIQSYQLDDQKQWQATGPLAALYEAKEGFIGEEKIGTHYQHLNKPAWEFEEGRVIVETAVSIAGAGENDVSWLDVNLRDEGLGYNRLFRLGTQAGVAPNKVFGYEIGATIGMGYTTYYAFLSCL